MDIISAYILYRSKCACNTSLKVYIDVGVHKDIHKKYGGKGIHDVGHIRLWINDSYQTYLRVFITKVHREKGGWVP